MRVSIVIPCHNGEAYLRETLRSVTLQTLPPVEVIVVDDGSTDSSAAIARDWGGTVRCVAGEGAGASAARNIGVTEARTDTAIMFMDADDLLGPTVLESLAKVLDAHPGAVARCPWHRLQYEGGCWVSAPASCAARAPWQDDLSAWLTGWYHPPCSLLWSREAYLLSGGWDPSVRVNTDGDIIMRALVAGVPLIPTKDAAAYYRRLPGEAVSLSGRRWTRTGVESRLAVLDGIARRLRERDSAKRYGAALGMAYGELAEGSQGAGLADLCDQARSAAHRHGGGSIRRRAWRRLRAATAHAARAADRLTSRRPVPFQSHAGPVPPRPPHDGERRPGAPAVSVIIPTYNRAPLLRRAIGSVRDQTLRDWELIVADDGSTDDTEAVVGSFGDDRIRYVRQDNAGVAAARNLGLRVASADLIAFLDSDDEWLPEKLERQVKCFAKGSPRVGLVYTGAQNIGGAEAGLAPVPASRGNVFAAMLLENKLHGGGSNAMIRRAVVDTIGGFDETLPAIEDYDFLLRVARFFEFDHVVTPLIRYHDEDPNGAANLTRRSRAFDANMRARATFHRRNRHEMRHSGVEHLFLLDSARRTLRSPAGRWRDGVRLAAAAVLARPLTPAAYPWLGRALVPAPVQHAVRDLRAAVVARLQASLSTTLRRAG